MDFSLSQDQRELVRWTADFVVRAGGPAYLRRLREQGQVDGELHAAMVQAGFPGIGLDGSDGLERALVCEQLGTGLLWGPLLDGGVLAAELLRRLDGPGARARLDALLAGRLVVVTAPGLLDLPGRADEAGDGLRLPATTVRSPWLGLASHVLVRVAAGDGGAVALVPAERWHLAPAGTYMDTVPVLEGSLPAGTLVDRGDVVDGPGLAPALAAARSHAMVALAAFCTGAAQRVVELATAYAKERRQFGRPIGAFQAQQHKLADAWLRVRQAQQLTYAAAVRTDPVPLQLAAAGALRLAARAFTEGATTASLVHGGYGLTTEFDVHLYFVTAKVLETVHAAAALGALGEAVRLEAAS